MKKKDRKKLNRGLDYRAAMNAVSERINLETADRKELCAFIGYLTRKLVDVQTEAYPLSEKSRRVLCEELDGEMAELEELEAQYCWNPNVLSNKMADGKVAVHQVTYKLAKARYENLRALVIELGYRVEIVETNTPGRMHHRLRPEGRSKIQL